jgi:hypothetical protein
VLEPAAVGEPKDSTGALPSARLSGHLVPLPGGTWALWRSLVLRGAGFPAVTVLRLAAPACAASADRLLDCEAAVQARRQQAIAKVHQALDELRRAQAWDDKSRRTPLLKALSALTGGKLPQADPAAATAEEIAALRRAWDEVAAARAEYERTYAAARSQTSEEIARTAGWSRFREAVVWQNLPAVGGALDEIARKPGASRNSQRRQHEELVASYLQRYCVKNDTIGFFGPVGWAELADGGAPVAVRPGPGLIDRREVYFETWCIDALAQRLAADPELRPWLAPRLRLGLHVAERSLHLPGGKVIGLSPEQARLLRACDGQRTARELAAALAMPAGPFAGPEQVYKLLGDLQRLGVVAWTLEVALELYPERTLRGRLAKIGDETLREQALGPLAELEEARARVARSAGNADALAASMGALEDTFTRLTGDQPRRHLGRFYAARGLVYEDCRRAIDVTFGPELIDRLGRPLTLLLESARWLAGELTRRVSDKLRLVHANLWQQSGSAAVDSHAFFTAAHATIFDEQRRDACFTEIESDFHSRWAQVLAIGSDAAERQVHRSAAELADRFGRAFGKAGPAWSLVRYFSPDVMIAARGEAAFRAGDFQLVLGEIHPTNTLSWSCFTSQYPRPQELLDHVASDLGSRPVVVPQFPKTRWVQRVNTSLVPPSFYRYEFHEQAPSRPECRALPAAEVVVEPIDGELAARTRDGRIRFAAVELFGLQLTEECTRLLRNLLPPGKRLPRVIIDDLVVARQRWSFAASDLDFAGLRDPRERFVAVRRWARRHAVPRFCFYKTPGETKPCYLDLDSPIYVDIFGRLVRGAAASPEQECLSLSEMLPDADHAWLPDSEGHLYTCELRLTAFDPATA